MGMMFGTQDDLSCIVDIPLTAANSEPLCLGFKVSMHFFVAGIYAKDEGYVLRVKGKQVYYPMPAGKELEELQAHSMIPSPLPSYSVPMWSYVFGYSLWIIIGLIGGAVGLKHLLTKRRLAKAQVVG